jgi:hypothetical protein
MVVLDSSAKNVNQGAKPHRRSDARVSQRVLVGATFQSGNRNLP